MMTIADNSVVTLFFSLSLPDGAVIDSNFDHQPATFTYGDGSLLPTFEQLLIGLRAGERRQFTLPPELAFGERKEGNLQRIDRKQFAADIELTPGLVVSFAAKEGGELPGVIHRLLGDKVEVDFNHPLAGRAIVFDVEIVGVAPAVTGG